MSLTARLVGGLLAAVIYVGLGLALGRFMTTVAYLVAPWALITVGEFKSPEAVEWAGVWSISAAIVASGAVGGWVYHRLSPRG